MMNTQAIDVVTFDFKGTRFLWVDSGFTGNQMVSFRCIMFLNDISLKCKKINEMRSYI